MTDISIPFGNSGYREDVPNNPTGVTLVSRPCVVWEITVAVEADGDAVVSFSDSILYDGDARKIKAVTSAEQKTIQLVYPKGKYFATGLSATSNIASVDVSVTYD